MNIPSRAIAMLSRPSQEWPVIDGEQSTTRDLAIYALVIALVPAIVNAVATAMWGNSVGLGDFGVTVRFSTVQILTTLLLSVVLALVTQWLLAFILKALAPSFDGRDEWLPALKLSVYSATAAQLASTAHVLPFGTIFFIIIGAVMSLYALWKGIPVLMKVPPQKVTIFTILGALLSWGAGIAASTLIGAITFGLSSLERSPGGGMTISTPNGSLNVDTKRVQQQLEALKSAGDRMAGAAPGTAGSAGSAGTTQGSDADGAAIRTVDSAKLREMLPDKLMGMPRTSAKSSSGGAAGIEASTAEAVYGEGGRRIELSFADLGSLGILSSMAGMFGVKRESDDGNTRNRMKREGNSTIIETEQRTPPGSEYMVMFDNGITVNAKAEGIGLDDLRKAVEGLDTKRVAALR